MTIVGHGFGLSPGAGGDGISVVRNVEVVLNNRVNSVTIRDRSHNLTLERSNTVTLEPRAFTAALEVPDGVISVREGQTVTPSPRKVVV
jgi:hypothetical protein